MLSWNKVAAVAVICMLPVAAVAESTGKYGDGFTFDSQRNLNVNVRAGGSGGGGGGSGAVYPAPSSSPFPVTGSVTVTNQPTPPATQAVTGTVSLGAPVDFSPATLSIPSPLPAVLSNGTGTPVPITAPNINGSAFATGLSVNAQMMGTDGSLYYPVLSEAGTGSLIVAPGGSAYTALAAGNTSGATIRFGRGRLVSIRSLSQTAQTNLLTCYDSLSGTGQIIWVGKLDVRESVPVNTPVQTGIFCQAPSGINSDFGMLFVWQ